MTRDEQIARSAWLSIFQTRPPDGLPGAEADIRENGDSDRWPRLFHHQDLRIALGAFVLWLRQQPRDDVERVAEAIATLPVPLQESARWIASPWLTFPEVSRFNSTVWAHLLDEGQDEAILVQLRDPPASLRLRLLLGLFDAWSRNPKQFTILLHRLLIREPHMEEWVVDLMAEADVSRSLISYDTRLLYFLSPSFRTIATRRLSIPDHVDSLLLAARGTADVGAVSCSYPTAPDPAAPRWRTAIWTEQDIDQLVACRSLPIDLDKLSSELGVGVCRVSDSPPWEGAILWNREWARPSIYVALHQPPKRFRFTWAHELAHLLTERLKIEDYAAGSPESHVEWSVSTSREQRINRLASRLLIPHRLLQPYKPWGRFDGKSVSSIAQTCDVSFEAAAYALMDLRDGRGVIVIENGAVARVRMGQGLPMLDLYRGMLLPTNSAAIARNVRDRFPSGYDVSVNVLAQEHNTLVLVDAT